MHMMHRPPFVFANPFPELHCHIEAALYLLGYGSSTRVEPSWQLLRPVQLSDSDITIICEQVAVGCYISLDQLSWSD